MGVDGASCPADASVQSVAPGLNCAKTLFSCCQPNFDDLVLSLEQLVE